MLMGNQMEKQMVAAGYETPKPKRPHKQKQFNCKKCGTVMENPDWFANGMYCPKCDNSFFLFNGR